jgi:TP901-1 family phage major tail protein
MAGFNGRAFTFDWDSTTLAGVRSRSLSISNEYVDVTTDDDLSWRTLLSDPGLRSMEVTISGVVTDEAVLADIMAAEIAAATLEATLPTALSTAGTLSGSWLISSHEMSGDHDGAVEFSTTFMSTGEITYTASSGV